MHRIFYFLLLLCTFSCNAHSARVILGDEQTDKYIPLMEGKKVALFSNMSGVVGDVILGDDGKPVERQQITDEKSSTVMFGTTHDTKFGPHVLDVLIGKGVNVTAIFSPEHGFRGAADAGEKVSSSVDEKTGVPILSLYGGGGHSPKAEDMDKFDELVIDIQDVGLRYYTYYVTMYHLMNACAKNNKKVVLLDRPNPNGFYVDGPILDTAKFRSGVGYLPIPIVHGMTLGELAQMINGEGWLDEGRHLDLTVIPCLNYTHQTKYSLIMPPSPNLKDMKAVYLYSSTCFFEGTEVTTGRGTDWPFEIYGHPAMTDKGFSFTPRSIPGATSPRYQDTECRGRDLRNVPLEKIWAGGVDLNYIIEAYNDLNRGTDTTWTGTPALPMGDSFFHRRGMFELEVGVDWVRPMIEAGKSNDEIKALWQEDIKSFKTQRRPYLLYEE